MWRSMRLREERQVVMYISGLSGFFVILQHQVDELFVVLSLFHALPMNIGVDMQTLDKEAMERIFVQSKNNRMDKNQTPASMRGQAYAFVVGTVCFRYAFRGSSITHPVRVCLSVLKFIPTLMMGRFSRAKRSP